ncbi:tRNA-splicing ligase RtcB [Halopolyspora algeriensis]|uniref:3'-phosphate/5'-hydroxy nucleic acid ligase n=1 Tax=Halopolyspora algeriensis TaxID=1500506 RepID=A0A368VS18_9ACTN|nr:tRNA-splicing ligase RtcB [Halopolyspora algeriensis]
MLPRIMEGLDAAIPRGAGRGAVWKLSGKRELGNVLLGGSRYAVEQGHGEQHDLDGRQHRVCVHRKGATRALPAGHAELPPDLRAVGQPVLIPGSMGTASYVLKGIPSGDAFFSTCHGAGRVRSRHQAARSTSGKHLREELGRHGIRVRGASPRGLAEEAPDAYKDVSEVVEAAEGANLCRKVARLVPVGVVKG